MSILSGISGLAVYGNTVVQGAYPYQIGQKIWSADFESGNQATYFNQLLAPETKDPCGPNHPGSVAQFAHSGTYAGYYYDSAHNATLCRSYYNMEFNVAGSCYSNPTCPTQIPDTENFYVEVWVYVPRITLQSWVSFVSIKFGPNYDGIMIDSGVVDGKDSHQALFIHDELFEMADL